MDTTFENYEVVKYLKDVSPSLYSTVEQLYITCEALLSEIPKTFSNYTLHDIGHSVRVIGYMNELIKDHLDQFSSLHLAIIIYVGLLHDTGMVVTDDEKERLFSEFEQKDSEFLGLSEKEKLFYLQDYIRGLHAKRVSSILNHKINADTRIKSLLYMGETKSYDLSKLVADICQSHTENCDWIKNHLESILLFENYKINPQHIAALLRIGDALDIDDRRAPYVLYKLLNPQGFSNSEWRKHIPISNYEKIQKAGDFYELLFSGQCSEPEIYRKLTEYIDWIQNDLVQVSSLCTDEYKLNINTQIQVKIKTVGFIDTPLRFNLEYRQIAKLLMGEKIYGSKKDGLRELLQNAIDAALLMKDIESSNPYSTYVPTVGIEVNKRAKQLIVFDNGIGMSEDVLQKYFFNIGNSYYASRDYHSSGYKYSPIGHFGIGFMACFMLSSRITLETKHYESGGLTKMSFDKESPYITEYDSVTNSFPLDHGTRIIMDYDQIIPNVFPSEKSIKDYITALLTKNGYNFIFINENGIKSELKLKRPHKTYLKTGENIEFEYKLSSYSDILFDPFYWFERSNSAYVIDSFFAETSFISLSFFDEMIYDLERELQTLESIDTIVDIAYFSDFPPFVAKLLLSYSEEAFDYYSKYQELRGFFKAYLLSFAENNALVWHDIPIILNRDIFNSFLESVEREGVERSLTNYSKVEYISILCREGELNNNTVLEVVSDYLELRRDEGATTEVDYYSKYPITPIKRRLNLLKSPNSDNYIHILEKYKDFEKKIYLKGIQVKDEAIVLPFAIDGIALDSVFLNIKADDYGVDISRNNFDSSAKEKIASRIAHIVYEDIAKGGKLSKEEKEMIDFFLKTYY